MSTNNDKTMAKDPIDNLEQRHNRDVDLIWDVVKTKASKATLTVFQTILFLLITGFLGKAVADYFSL